MLLKVLAWVTGNTKFVGFTFLFLSIILLTYLKVAKRKFTY